MVGVPAKGAEGVQHPVGDRRRARGTGGPESHRGGVPAPLGQQQQGQRSRGRAPTRQRQGGPCAPPLRQHQGSQRGGEQQVVDRVGRVDRRGDPHHRRGAGRVPPAEGLQPRQGEGDEGRHREDHRLLHEALIELEEQVGPQGIGQRGAQGQGRRTASGPEGGEHRRPVEPQDQQDRQVVGRQQIEGHHQQGEQGQVEGEGDLGLEGLALRDPQVLGPQVIGEGPLLHLAPQVPLEEQVALQAGVIEGPGEGAVQLGRQRPGGRQHRSDQDRQGRDPGPGATAR